MIFKEGTRSKTLQGKKTHCFHSGGDIMRGGEFLSPVCLLLHALDDSKVSSQMKSNGTAHHKVKSLSFKILSAFK